MLRGGLTQTMVSEGARPRGRGRSGDCEVPHIRKHVGTPFLQLLLHYVELPLVRFQWHLCQKAHPRAKVQRDRLCVFSYLRTSIIHCGFAGIIERGVPQAYVRACASSENAAFGARFKGLSLYFLYTTGNLIRIKMGLDTYPIRIQTRTPLSRYPPYDCSKFVARESPPGCHSTRNGEHQSMEA